MRSTERSRRAASAPTMLARTGASSSGRSASTSVRGDGVGLISTESVGCLSVPPPVQGHPHRDFGAAVEPAGDREAAREGRDQRQAEPQARAVDIGLGPDAPALVADDDREPFGIGVGLDRQRARLPRVGVGDDVHAGLGHDGLEVGDSRFVHPDLLSEPGEGVPDHSDVLRFCRKQHLEPPGLFADSRGFGHTAIPAGEASPGRRAYPPGSRPQEYPNARAWQTRALVRPDSPALGSARESGAV